MRLCALAIALILPATAFAQDGDAAAGEKVFRKCMACHAIDPAAPGRAGPHLAGIVGRTTGTVEGYAYTAAMKKVGEEGHVWTPEEIDAFITNPKGVVPGTKMTFAGLKNPKERADLIAFLATKTQ